MRKNENRAGLVFAAGLAVLAAYWALVLFAMQSRIGASYGRYPLFETVSVLRALAAPLPALITGAVFFFKNRLKAWQYLLGSAAAPVMMELLGNLSAMVLYGQSFRDTAVLLKTPFMLFMYAVTVIASWTVLNILRGILRAVKKKKAAPGFWDTQNRDEEERRAAPQSEPVRTYSGSGLMFFGYWLKWLAVCVLGSGFAAGAVIVYVLHSADPAPLFFAIGTGAALSVAVAWARGSVRIEVGGDMVTVKRRGRVTGVYAYKDCTITAARTARLLEGVILTGVGRDLVMRDKSGHGVRVQCRCFSEKTFTAMADEIQAIQRSMTRQAAEGESGAVRGAYAESGRTAPEKRILPMPGEDGFVSFDFTINKDQMVSAERGRYRKIILGLLACCPAIYAAWYFFVYRPLPDPVPELPYITGALIVLVYFILPSAVMALRFAKEQKRIPDSIIVESTRFVIDGQPFERAHVQNFEMTRPGWAKVGTASHRMHIVFLYYGVRHVRTAGSGLVKSAGFPDYSLLYAAFDAQRTYYNTAQSEPRRPERNMYRTTVELTRFTSLTVEAPGPAELAELVRRM